MKKILYLLLVMLPIFAVAAPAKKSSKHPTFTHKYKDAPLRTVLADLERKTDYVLVYDENEIDLDKRITMQFKDASAKSVLKKVLDKDMVYKSKKNKIFLTRAIQPEQIFVKASTPASVDEDSVRIVSTYVDTTYTVSCRMVTKELKQPQRELVPTRKGHYIQTTVGLGYSSLGYGLRTSNEAGEFAKGEKTGVNRGDFGGNVSVQYAYFFTENWGITAGVGFSGYGSYGVLNHEEEFPGMVSTNGDPYTHLTSLVNWTEHQTAHMVDIPVGVQYQYPVSPKAHLYAGLGLRLGFPVLADWHLQRGYLEQSGRFPQWGMTIYGHDLEAHDFYTQKVGEDFQKDKHALPLKAVSVGVTADLGVMLPVSEQVDVMVGAYAQVGCNNINASEREAISCSPFVYPTNGMVGSNYATAVRPYQVGVKIGVSWHAKPVALPVESTYERLQMCDTTVALVERRDTVMKPVKPAARQIQQLMRKSVIWFDVNSTTPKLEPADILDRIAAVLIANPEQHVVVSGHASKEGNARKNRWLSEKRAQVVADLLMEKGVPAEQLSVEAHSSDIEYVVENGVVHTISLDRRTEIIPVQ